MSISFQSARLLMYRFKHWCYTTCRLANRPAPMQLVVSMFFNTQRTVCKFSEKARNALQPALIFLLNVSRWFQCRTMQILLLPYFVSSFSFQHRHLPTTIILVFASSFPLLYTWILFLYHHFISYRLWWKYDFVKNSRKEYIRVYSILWFYILMYSGK